MIDRRTLNQLRLKYEHSIATCSLCGRKGIIGEHLKIIDAVPSEDPNRRSYKIIAQCSDKLKCQRQADKPSS